MTEPAEHRTARQRTDDEQAVLDSRLEARLIADSTNGRTLSPEERAWLDARLTARLAQPARPDDMEALKARLSGGAS